MSTDIEWVQNPDGTPGETWNPLRGCKRVSEGCRNCYAEKIAHRFNGAGLPYEGLTRDGKWTGKVLLIRSKLTEPLRRRKPTTYFVNSMSDLFYDGVEWGTIMQILAVMILSPWHTFIVLTKRPERMLSILREIEIDATRNWAGGLSDCADLICHNSWKYGGPHAGEPLDVAWPPPNVWLGVSIEDQATLERYKDLRQTPAAVKFISYEPALAPVSMHYDDAPYLWSNGGDGEPVWQGPDWVIAGGESGHGARPMHPDWARQIRDQCKDAGVAYFFKGWGKWVVPPQMAEVTYADIRDHGAGPPFNETAPIGVDKKRAGRLLDGCTHNELPERGA